MIRYYSAAAVLKIFSSHPRLETIYRRLGSWKKNSRRPASQISWKYKFRTEKFLSVMGPHLDERKELDIFELGTGWLHWESLMLRSVCKCKCTLYDVVDCRDLNGFKRVLSELLDPGTRQELGLPQECLNLAAVEAAINSEGFDQAYSALGFQYVLDAENSMKMIPSNSYDIVVSSDVFEHLPYGEIPRILKNLHRIMRPDGIAYHQIVLTDHLKIYAPRIHAKQYLKYSDAHWEGFLSNRLQYINRVQLPEWRDLISSAGFSIVSERCIGATPVDDILVNKKYLDIKAEDLSCTVVQFLLKKPLQN